MSDEHTSTAPGRLVDSIVIWVKNHKVITIVVAVIALWFMTRPKPVVVYFPQQQGSGYSPNYFAGQRMKCVVCNGRGHVRCGCGGQSFCSRCRGSGDASCMSCGGSGYK